MAELLRTDRLLVRDWSGADAEAALRLHRDEAFTLWLPELEDIPDADAMQAVLQRWAAEQLEMSPGTGRWALVALDGGALIGGISLLPMPVPEADVEMEYQLAPEYWGEKYADKYPGMSLQVFRLRPADLAGAVRRRPG
jgi:RimJ/RimL family protein N-acetyltransferase